MTSTIEKQNARTNWIESILYNIGSSHYFLVGQFNMVGIETLIFAQKQLKDYISDVEYDNIKTGFGGKLGNKGTVAVRFDVFNTSICILNCHLSAG